jgi:hypothetical protein
MTHTTRPVAELVGMLGVALAIAEQLESVVVADVRADDYEFC